MLRNEKDKRGTCVSRYNILQVNLCHFLQDYNKLVAHS